jgi:hypothetical protein
MLTAMAALHASSSPTRKDNGNPMCTGEFDLVRERNIGTHGTEALEGKYLPGEPPWEAYK